MVKVIITIIIVLMGIYSPMKKNSFNYRQMDNLIGFLDTNKPNPNLKPY